jgi:hypothetical protein
MNVDLKETKTVAATFNFEVEGRQLSFGKVKGRHMVTAQTKAPRAGSVELGYRTLHAVIVDEMGSDAPTLEYLLDLDTEIIAPLLEAIQS